MDQELVQYLDTRFQSLEQRIDQQFGQVDQRFEGIDRRFEQIDHRFEQIDGRFEGIDRQFQEFRGEMNERLEEVKRHTGVLVEDLRYQVRLVAEGFATFVEPKTKPGLTNASAKPRRCSAPRSNTSLGKTTSSASVSRTSNGTSRISPSSPFSSILM